jgi:hypothetical protein
MAQREYRRLTRTRDRALFSFGTYSRTSLWLGRDHLLCIDASSYTERYKRFYFRDIQAITLVASKRRMIWNWVLGVLFAVPAFFLIAGLLATWDRAVQSSDTVTFVVLGIPAGLLLVLLLINNLRGRACVGYLRTAVQIEQLPSLSRFRQARKVLDRIRPLITEVQGGLAPEEIPARMRGLVETSVRP